MTACRLLGVLTTVALLSAALPCCERFERATQANCEAMLSHGLQLVSGEVPKSLDIDDGWRQLLAIAIKWGATEIIKRTGEWRNQVNRCMTLMTLHDTRCGLRARTLKAFFACEPKQ